MFSRIQIVFLWTFYKGLPGKVVLIVNKYFPDKENQIPMILEAGITFGEAYQLVEHIARKVEYAGKEELIAAIFEKYPMKRRFHRKIKPKE